MTDESGMKHTETNDRIQRKIPSEVVQWVHLATMNLPRWLAHFPNQAF